MRIVHTEMLATEEPTWMQYVGKHVLAGIGLGIGAAIVALMFRMIGVRA